MKSFYEMWVMLEGMDYDAWLQKPYQDAYADEDISFSRVLGEDEGEPFTLDVDIDGGRWEARGGIWVAGYVPNGSENPASRPVAYTAGQKGKHGIISKVTGTEFESPGKRLELLPASIRDEAVKWVEKRVQWEIEHYKPHDPADYQDEDDYNPDPHGYGWEDYYWSQGPGRDR